MKIGDIISWKETITIGLDTFTSLSLSWESLFHNGYSTCLDPPRSLRTAISWTSASGSRISYSTWVLASPLPWVLKETAALAFSFLRTWLQDFYLGETSGGWVANKQILLTPFLHEHPRPWTGVHRNTGQCRSEENSGCHPIQPLPQTIINYSKFLRAIWSWAWIAAKIETPQLHWEISSSVGLVSS